MFSTWVFPDFSLILFYPYWHLYIFPIWVTPGCTHMGFHICFPIRFTHAVSPHNKPIPFVTHTGVHIYFPLGFPRLFPNNNQMGVHICFLFGFTRVDPIISPYWHLHMHVSHLVLPRLFQYKLTHMGTRIYFPFGFPQVVPHMIPIWAFTFVSHLGLPRFNP